jgi:hypothetical protein
MAMALSELSRFDGDGGGRWLEASWSHDSVGSDANALVGSPAPPTSSSSSSSDGSTGGDDFGEGEGSVEEVGSVVVYGNDAGPAVDDYELLMTLESLRCASYTHEARLHKLESRIHAASLYTRMLSLDGERRATRRRLRRLEDPDATAWWVPGEAWPEGDAAATRIQARWRAICHVRRAFEQLAERDLAAGTVQRHWRRRLQRAMEAPPGCRWWLQGEPPDLRRWFRVVRTCAVTLRRDLGAKELRSLTDAVVLGRREPCAPSIHPRITARPMARGTLVFDWRPHPPAAP